MRPTRLAVLAITTALLAAFLPALPAQASPPGPFVTFLFSRTEQWPAQNCLPDLQGGVSLTGTVAPYLSSLGIAATGTVNTLATASTEGCVHHDETLASSWSDLTALAGYGWTFGPHEYDGPAKVDTLTPAQDWNVTCGQAQALALHGLGPGTGMIAYPGAQGTSPAIASLQANYGASCFDWGRTYGPSGLTTQQNGQTAPYWQQTLVLKGGPGTGSPAYTSPAAVIAKIQALQPGQWLTIQVYLLVTGTNPPGDSITWSCGQPGIASTSSDVERYCYSDFQQVAQAAATTPGVTVTDPLTVGTAFGRSAPGMPPPSP